MMEHISTTTRFVVRQEDDDPAKKLLDLISDPFSSEASCLLTCPSPPAAESEC